MLFSILTLLAIIYIAYRISPVEHKEDALVHGAGQIGLLAAVALFGVDYFTSFYYGTGEMMSALHPYGLQKWGYIAAAVIAVANMVFGGLYIYSLGIFNEGGGSYTASMRYLWPTLSLLVAVVLIQDYTLTIVVSALSGGDQLLSILGLYGRYWWLHFRNWRVARGVYLVFNNPWAWRICSNHFHVIGCIHYAHYFDGGWSVHGSFPWFAGCASHRGAQNRLLYGRRFITC